jgi:hypothetical protein
MLKIVQILVVFSMMLLVVGAASADNVTFKVDMSYLSELGLFDPATEGVAIRGDITNWHDTKSNLFDWALTDDEPDSLYEGTFDVGTTSPINYKFVIYTLGDTTDVKWEADPNRQLALTGSDQVLDVVVWDIEVKFQVDMTRAERIGVFDPDSNGVSLRGNFTSWNDFPGTLPDWALTDDDADKIYTGTFSGFEMKELAYKYVITDQDTNLLNWEETISDNRMDTLTTVGDVELDVAFWDSIPPPATAITAAVLFETDVTALLELNAFDPTLGDTLQVRGNFNGWGDSDPEISIMRQSLFSDTQYELVVPVTDVVGADIEYKFFIKYNDQDGNRDVPGDGNAWEEPASTSGANRKYSFTADAQQQVPIQYFNDILAEDVIPEGTTVTVEMTAFMREALADPESGVTGNGRLQMDTQDPIWRFMAGVDSPVEDTTLFVYEDTDGDSTYTMSFDLVGPIPNWIQYRLIWDGVEEQGGDTHTGGRRRVRFVRKEDGSWPTTFKMGIDKWNTVDLKPLVVETRDGGTIDDDTTATSVELVDGLTPATYELAQNYPNPFNPSTTIQYSIQQPGLVNITLYNQLGQKVMELVNEYQAVGTYKVNWNMMKSHKGSLPSGVYFYRMQVGDFKDTKRMLLLK